MWKCISGAEREHLFRGGVFLGGGPLKMIFFGVVNEFWGGVKKIFLGG